MNKSLLVAQPESQNKPKPWKSVKLNSNGIWHAFENPETKSVHVMSENGFFTLTPIKLKVKVI